MGLPAVPPNVTKVVLPAAEMQIKKVIQQAQKFQRRGKRKTLTGFVFFKSTAENIFQVDMIFDTLSS